MKKDYCGAERKQYSLCKLDDLDSPAIVIDHPFIIDVETGTVKPVETVEIKNGTIAYIGEKRPNDCQRIDGSNKYLIPGLWDMHTHILSNATLAFPMYLANGVTGIRDMGSDITELLTWQEYPKPMPRIVYTGPIIDGFNTIPLARLFTTGAEDVDIQITTVLHYGADIVKVHNNLPADAFFALAERCKKEGVTFSGHIPIEVNPFDAVAAGQKTIEHMIGIHKATSSKGEMLRQKMIDGSCTGWDTLLFDCEAFKSFDQELFDKFVALMDEHDALVCPTLSGLEKCMGAFDLDSSWMQKYPTQSQIEIREYNKALASNEWMEDFSEKLSIFFEMNMKLCRKLHEANVPMLAGTDTLWIPYHYETGLFYGDSLQRELELLCEIGMSPVESLRTATLNPAKYLGIDDRMGTVSTGKVADMVLLDKNPLEDIRNTRTIQGIFLGGNYFSSEDIEKMQLPK